MNNNALGRLERVTLRAVWLSESGNFTPWLAKEENLSLLADTIGLDLDLEATEKFVGPFRADIVCKDAFTNSWVLIENQLERTDHSHLGQLLTYAAGLDAVTIVWIAEHFTDEHRAALDWLNEVTAEQINFFGLEIELWRIGDSPVAPKFNVISQPNDWTKRVAADRQTVETSDIAQLKLEYWTAFQQHLEANKSFLKSQKPSTHYWTNFAIGRSNFSLAAMVGMRDGFIGVNIVISGPDAKVHFRMLELEREAIERDVGEALEWRDVPENKQSRVAVFRRGIEATDRDHWPTYHAWTRQRVEAFHRAFADRVRKLSAAAYSPPPIAETSPDDSLQ